MLTHNLIAAVGVGGIGLASAIAAVEPPDGSEFLKFLPDSVIAASLIAVVLIFMREIRAMTTSHQEAMRGFIHSLSKIEERMADLSKSHHELTDEVKSIGQQLVRRR